MNKSTQTEDERKKEQQSRRLQQRPVWVTKPLACVHANSCYTEILPRIGRYTLMVAYSPDEHDDGKPLGCINVSGGHAAEGGGRGGSPRRPHTAPNTLVQSGLIGC